jgi:hypothetical protein
MTPARFERLCLDALKIFKSLAPRDTGNLADVATSLEVVGPNECRIVISAEKAPYAVYTNVNWGQTSPLIWRSKKHPEWNGKKSSFLWNEAKTPKQNPNEGWIDMAVFRIAENIADSYGGHIKHDND